MNFLEQSILLIVIKSRFRLIMKYTYGHLSKSSERTLDIWDPKFLWTPEHSIHIRTPKFKLAQSGSVNKYDDELNESLIEKTSISLHQILSNFC